MRLRIPCPILKSRPNRADISLVILTNAAPMTLTAHATVLRLCAIMQSPKALIACMMVTRPNLNGLLSRLRL